MSSSRRAENVADRLRQVFAGTDEWLTGPEIRHLYVALLPPGSLMPMGRRIDDGLRALEETREVIQTHRDGVPVWRRSARLQTNQTIA